MRPESSPRLPLIHAVALGALHGPAELVPVSSSAHVALVPRLLDWPSAALPDELRKAFEVALHTGTLPVLVVLGPRPSPRVAILSTAPAALAALLLEGPIERRLGGIRATAAGLLAGSALLLAADALADDGRDPGHVSSADAVTVGVAQVLALWPGVSRLGITIAAARLRGYDRAAAFGLGRQVGLPVVAGATLLKAYRLLRAGLAPELRAPFAAGALSALGATVAAAPLRRRTAIAGPAAERVVLAALALARLRRSRR
jgi:undecaprenyl-diphosphatase